MIIGFFLFFGFVILRLYIEIFMYLNNEFVNFFFELGFYFVVEICFYLKIFYFSFLNKKILSVLYYLIWI